MTFQPNQKVEFIKDFKIMEGVSLGETIDAGQQAIIIDPYRNSRNVLVPHRYWVMTLAGAAAVPESYMKGL